MSLPSLKHCITLAIALSAIDKFFDFQDLYTFISAAHQLHHDVGQKANLIEIVEAIVVIEVKSPTVPDDIYLIFNEVFTVPMNDFDYNQSMFGKARMEMRKSLTNILSATNK